MIKVRRHPFEKTVFMIGGLYNQGPYLQVSEEGINLYEWLNKNAKHHWRVVSQGMIEVDSPYDVMFVLRWASNV